MKARANGTKGERPDLSDGDPVIVAEPGIPEWHGTALSVKPGTEQWWVDVRNGGSNVWVLPARHVRKETT